MTAPLSTPTGGDYLDPERSATAGGRIVAAFETNAGARLAHDALVAAGFGDGAVHVIERAEHRAAGTQSTEEERRESLLHVVGSLFGGTDSAAQLNIADDPHHARVVLDPGADEARVRHILSACSPVEIYRL